jgi:predicted HTH domain antitoxin
MSIPVISVAGSAPEFMSGPEAMESMVIEGYRAGTLSHALASRMLGLSRFQFDGFLKDRRIHDHAYDVADFVEDSESALCA